MLLVTRPSLLSPGRMACMQKMQEQFSAITITKAVTAMPQQKNITSIEAIIRSAH
jgi:hypothetical protein